MAEKESPDSLDNSLNGEFPDDIDQERSSSAASASSESENEKQQKKRRIQIPSPQSVPPSFMVAASPPKFFSLEKLMEATKGVKNMVLAHEIAVDSEFKLERLEPQLNSIEKQVKETMHRAFWDAFQEKLNEDPPDFSHAIVLIEEIKENLMSQLLPQHVRMKAQICEVLDTELIKQKMENDAFDIYYYSNYVINIMAKLCAPVRDDQVASLKEIKDIVPLFKEIFSVMDAMKMDMANFSIQQVRPYLQQQSADYEQKKFQDFLSKQQEAGVDGLELTKQWLKRSFDRMTDVEEATSEGATAAPLVTPAAILNEAFIEILQWDDNNIFPETLMMDQGRFMDLRDKTSQLTLIASVLLVTYSTVGAPISGVQSLKEKLKSEISTILEDTAEKDLADTMTNVSIQINKSVNDFMTSHGFQARDESQQKILAGQLKALSQKTHTVYKLMSKRVLDFIKHMVSHHHREPLKVPAGFSVVEKELGQICGRFLQLISHNRSVFVAHYTEIINHLLQKKMEDLSPRG